MEVNGKNIFRPRARIIKTIGEELISNDLVAIVELVKNSYDADASKVEICFEGDIENGDGKILVKDDGSGMNLDILKEGWMEPATILKKQKQKTDKGRRILGEKGVGRFASAKLSKKLKIITKELEGKEIVSFFDWTDFEKDEKYLDEISCDWKIGEEEEIKGNGTIIELSDLNSEWDWDKIQELRFALSRLLNPISKIKNFKIFLILPEKFKRLTGEINPPDSLNHPFYSIKGKIDREGTFKMNYLGTEKKEEEIKGKVILKGGHSPTCGNFEFEFRVWDRDSNSLKEWASKVNMTTKDVKRDLNEASGINIYRDGFKVFPYGRPKLDWLGLDASRVQNPTMRLSNNQILGHILIGMDTNPQLKDQSNREGIVESKEFEDFKKTILELLKELETRRYKERRPDKLNENQNKNLFSDINISSVIELVKSKLPNDVETTLTLIQTNEKIQENVKRVQEVLSRYRRLSTLGQLIDSVLHDGNSYLSKTTNELLILEKKLKGNLLETSEVERSFALIKNERNALANLFKRLEPFSGRRSKKKKEKILEESINNVFELFKGDIKRQKVKIILPTSETKVEINDQDFQTIILNLLQNSLYWLEKETELEKSIKVEILREEKHLSIIFADNGPGIDEDDIEYIFDPYFSKKPDGIGLGLTITGELINEMGGELELIESDIFYKGTSFKLKFTINENDNKNFND